jgi:CBS domain-containing protein
MRAADLMTEEPMRVTPDTTVGEAIALTALATVRHLPVVDGRKCVGVVSERDMLGLLSDHDAGDPEVAQQKIADVMSEEVLSVKPDAPVADVIDRLIEEGVGALLVIDDDERLVGIISYVDILEALKPYAPSP